MKSMYNYYEYRKPTVADRMNIRPSIYKGHDTRLDYPWYFRVSLDDGYLVGSSVHQALFSADILSSTGYYWNKLTPKYIPILVRKGTEFD